MTSLNPFKKIVFLGHHFDGNGWKEVNPKKTKEWRGTGLYGLN